MLNFKLFGTFGVGHWTEEHMRVKRSGKNVRNAFLTPPPKVCDYLCTLYTVGSQIEVNKWQQPGFTKWGACLVNPSEILHNLDDIVNTNGHLGEQRIASHHPALPSPSSHWSLIVVGQSQHQSWKPWVIWTFIIKKKWTRVKLVTWKMKFSATGVKSTEKLDSPVQVQEWLNNVSVNETLTGLILLVTRDRTVI